MKLKLTKTEWEGLDEGIRKLYEEKDGEYTLQVEGIEDTGALKNALSAERKSREELAKQVKAWERTGKKPEEISDLLARLEEEEAKRAEKTGEWEKLKSQLIESHKKETAKKDEEISKMRASLESYLIDAAATAVIAELKGIPQLLLPHVKSMTKVTENNGAYGVQIVDAGTGAPRVKSNGEPLSIKELVEEMKQSEIYGRAFEPSGTTGGGAGGGGKGGARPNGNPWKRWTAAWNLTEQGRIFKENPALAKQLMEEAKAS